MEDAENASRAITFLMIRFVSPNSLAAFIRNRHALTVIIPSIMIKSGKNVKFKGVQKHVYMGALPAVSLMKQPKMEFVEYPTVL